MTNDQDQADDAHDDNEGRAGERCPVCRHFNSPPEGDTCAHIVAWRWDGQVESLGPGAAFASAWSELAALVFESGSDSTEDIVLRAHARRNPRRAKLLKMATQDMQLGDVLERLAKAVPGGGWSTGGMLGGSGHGW